MDKVSFLMTVYNAQNYLKEVIETILNQSYKNLELIIVNDGSTDQSAQIINEFSKHDKRINFINREINKGRSYSLNEALKHCTTELVFINDSDDISTLDRVEKILNYYNNLKDKRKVGLIGASGIVKNTINNIEVKNNFKKGFIIGNKVGKVFNHKIYCTNPFIHSSIMYKKSALEKIGGFPTEVTSSIDHLTIIKISKYYEVHGITDSLITRLVTGENYFMKPEMTVKSKKNFLIVKKWIASEIPYGHIYNIFSTILNKIKG